MNANPSWTLGLASKWQGSILGLVTGSPVHPTLKPEMPCPCGSGRRFDACCEPLLQQTRQASTAGELMRSRYTAHVVGDHRHLHRTYAGTAGQPFVEPETEAAVNWTRLVVHEEGAGSKPGTAMVDFSAYYDENGTENALHEKAEFVQTDGTWIYTRALRNGPAPIKSTAPKVGRNEPCPCGSGKKFKHCCGR